MKSLRLIAILLAIITFIMLLSGCNNTPDDKKTEVTTTVADTTLPDDRPGTTTGSGDSTDIPADGIEHDISEFVVVRAEKASSEVKTATSSLWSTMRAELGNDFLIMTDLEKDLLGKIGSEGADSPELLIGATSRAESTNAINELASFREKCAYDYIIRFKNNVIIVAGVTDAATVAAVEYFKTNVIPKIADGSAKSGFEYISREDRPSVMVNGIALEKYTIVMSDNTHKDVKAAVEAFKNRAIELSGAMLKVSETSGTHNIVVDCSAANTAGKAEIKFSGNDLMVTGGNSKPVVEVLNKLTEKLSIQTPITSSYKEKATVSFKAYFTGTTEKNALQYKCGETIKFEISLLTDNEVIGCDKFKYKIVTDDNAIAPKTGTIDGSSGTLELTTKLTNPGFVYVEVEALDESGTPIVGLKDTKDPAIFTGGAGADVDKIKQTYSEPSDFRTVWQNQVKRLDSVPFNAVREPILGVKDGYVAYKITLDCVGDKPVWGILTMPKNADNKSLPAKLVFTGYGKDPVNTIYEPGTIVLSTSIHGVNNNAISGYNPGDNWGLNDSGNIESFYFMNVMLRDIQAARYLISLPQYMGGRNLTITGGSMGAMRSVTVASNIGTNVVKKLELSIPWSSDLGRVGSASAGDTRVPRTWGLSISSANSTYLYFDIANHIKYVDCPEIEIDCALGDYVSPPRSVATLYNNAKANSKIKKGSFEALQNATHGDNPVKFYTYKVNFTK